MAEQLITKYRPKDFSEVVGNTAALQALDNVIKSASRPHGYLFIGPPGSGKTTLAQLLVNTLAAKKRDFNAGEYSSIKEMKYIVSFAKSDFLRGAKGDLLIIDEASNLRPKAWPLLLNLLEYPPKDCYVALCTTDPKTVPAAIVRRCFTVTLDGVGMAELRRYAAEIARLEQWSIPNDVLETIVRAADGRPGLVLTLLLQGHAAQSVDELLQIIPPPELLGYKLS